MRVSCNPQNFNGKVSINSNNGLKVHFALKAVDIHIKLHNRTRKFVNHNTTDTNSLVKVE